MRTIHRPVAYNRHISNDLHKDELEDIILSPTNTINTKLMVTANSVMRISFESLANKLNKMNYKVNWNLTKGKFLDYPQYFPRVAMYCFLQNGDAEQLTHAHILLDIPSQYPYKKVIDEMNNCFADLDNRKKVYDENGHEMKEKRFHIWHDANVDDEVGHVKYVMREMTSKWDKDYSYCVF